MAEKLDHFPKPDRNPQGYPWGDWLDGSPWKLIKGEDYHVKTKSFVSNAQDRARRMGGRIRTTTLANDTGVVMRYEPRTTPKPPPASLVRVWARANGWPEISEKGGIPADIIAAYLKANPT